MILSKLPMVTTLKCPICKKKTVWQGNPTRPFCSERCKLVDLGKWADGSYALEADSTDFNQQPEDSSETNL